MLTILQSYDSSYYDNSGSAAAGAIFGIGMLFLFSHLSFYWFCRYKVFKRLVEKMHGQDLYQFIMLLSLSQIIKNHHGFSFYFMFPYFYYALFRNWR